MVGVELRPFHETVVQAILMASVGEWGCLAMLIKTTKIPKNHDMIVKAWGTRSETLGLHDNLGVPESVLQQKRDLLIAILRSELDAHCHLAMDDPVPVAKLALAEESVKAAIAGCREGGVPEKDILSILGANAGLAK